MGGRSRTRVTGNILLRLRHAMYVPYEWCPVLNRFQRWLALDAGLIFTHPLRQTIRRRSFSSLAQRWKIRESIDWAFFDPIWVFVRTRRDRERSDRQPRVVASDSKRRPIRRAHAGALEPASGHRIATGRCTTCESARVRQSAVGAALEPMRFLPG